MFLRVLGSAGLSFALAIGCYESHAGLADASSAPPADADGGVRCTGDDILGASELLARAAEFDGRVVRARGVVAEAGPRTCTERACAADAPCCNTCSTQVRLAGPAGDGPILSGSGGAMPGCAGDECHLVCTPYDVGREYVLRGTFQRPLGVGQGTLTVVGAPGDVCEESPPPDHRGAYQVRVKSSRLVGECERFAEVVGASGRVFASIGDPGQLEMWHALAAPPGTGRLAGSIAPDRSRATFSASLHWACCDHALVGTFPDSRALEAQFTVREAGSPECAASFELVGMRGDVPCDVSYGSGECFRAGGMYAFVGPDTGEVCSCPTFDGHRTCASDTDCAAACLANVAGGSCADLAAGNCTPGRNWSGCYCWLATGPASAPTCWD